MTKERLFEILQTYVNCDLGYADPAWVREILVDDCGMTRDEIEEAKLEYIFPDDYWEISNMCPRCGWHLLPSKIDGYVWQCQHCDEDFYDFEVIHRN